ncbi:MFS transporter [Mycobacterium szulgai]|uniref:MFS transporter n=1 Tax=Mycobacterium szulgai TaxID=1787 RepID=UPI001FE507D2|nr:MFS transporter [Mycobacterium szulgai]
MPASRLSSPATDAPRNPYGRLLTQGTCYTAGMQLSNVSVVLPFVCAHLGMTWTAALLFPAYSIGSITGNSLSPAILQRTGHRRHVLLALIAASAATLLVCDAIIPWTSKLVGPVFMLTSALGGIVVALSSVAYTDMIASKLAAARRGQLFLTQGAAGSTLATFFTLLVVPMLGNGNQTAAYHYLLWLGAAALYSSAIAALLVGPMPSVGTTRRPSLRETYRQGFAAAGSQRWFRQYALTYLLFAPISLGTSFYSLRAAKHNGTLHVLIILSSIGLVVGSVAWRKVYTRFGVRGMLLGSASLSSAGAVLSIVAETSGQWYHMWAYGTVFLLATVSGQPVVAAAVSWISVFAAEEHRGTLIGFSMTLVAIESAVLGAGLGGLAQARSTVLPVVLVLVLAVIAGIAALRAPGPIGETSRSRSWRVQRRVSKLVVPETTDLVGRVHRGQIRHAWASWHPEPARPVQTAAAVA